MTTKALHFKWTVSRGQNTYGDNICTLLVDGEKVGRCNGGGYDMKGTSFAQWLESAYQSELLAKLEPKAIIVGARHYDTKKGRVSYFPINNYYGAELKEFQNADGTTKKSICLDGGCGFDCMRAIAASLGITLQWNKESDKYKNHSFYTVIIGL